MIWGQRRRWDWALVTTWILMCAPWLWCAPWRRHSASYIAVNWFAWRQRCPEHPFRDNRFNFAIVNLSIRKVKTYQAKSGINASEAFWRTSLLKDWRSFFKILPILRSAVISKRLPNSRSCQGPLLPTAVLSLFQFLEEPRSWQMENTDGRW